MTLCVWCKERLYLDHEPRVMQPDEPVWKHVHSRLTTCYKHVGAAAFVRGVAFAAMPEYTITCEVE